MNLVSPQGVRFMRPTFVARLLNAYAPYVFRWSVGGEIDISRCVHRADPRS
jgi:hypothetical protein